MRSGDPHLKESHRSLTRHWSGGQVVAGFAISWVAGGDCLLIRSTVRGQRAECAKCRRTCNTSGSRQKCINGNVCTVKTIMLKCIQVKKKQPFWSQLVGFGGLRGLKVATKAKWKELLTAAQTQSVFNLGSNFCAVILDCSILYILSKGDTILQLSQYKVSNSSHFNNCVLFTLWTVWVESNWPRTTHGVLIALLKLLKIKMILKKLYLSSKQ